MYIPPELIPNSNVDIGFTVLSDQHPSFFVLNRRGIGTIDVGWIDIPGVSRWRFATLGDSTFFQSSLSSIVLTMEGKRNTEETMEEFASLAEDILRSMIKKGRLIPFTAPEPTGTSEEGESLMREFFGPGMVPEAVFHRYFGAEKAEKVIQQLKNENKIVGTMWAGKMKLYISSWRLLQEPSSEEKTLWGIE